MLIGTLDSGGIEANNSMGIEAEFLLPVQSWVKAQQGVCVTAAHYMNVFWVEKGLQTSKAFVES